MMKKLLALGLLIAAPYVTASPVEYQTECAKGGTRSVTGDYMPVTGKFALETVVSHCTNQRGTTSNGTVTASGVFKATTGSSATLEAQISSDLSRENDSQLISRQCDKTISGIYDSASGYLEGTSSHNCEKSGNIYTPVLELVAGFDEEESLESKSRSVEEVESIITGTWANCFNGNLVRLEIKENGITTYTLADPSAPSIIYDCEGMVNTKRYLGLCSSGSLGENHKITYVLDVSVIDGGGAAASINGSITALGITDFDTVQCETKIANPE